MPLCHARQVMDTNTDCSDLEKAVEQLSQMLGEEIQAETVKELRQRMIDKTVCFP